jgi:hypothetical protein
LNHIQLISSAGRTNFKFVVLSLLIVLPTVIGISYSQIPDYNRPYAPIYTDKDVYTWTDKVRITIVAPSWNENRYAIDSIGGETSHPIRISTSSNFLKPYRLVETEANSGIFTGEVILTGFLHDANGDGKPDTNPRTMGNGPTGGLLETTRDDGITISFEFAKGVVLTHSAKIKWNEGTIRFSESNYLVSDQITVRVIDQDMNLNPETPDRVIVDVTSDSDFAGIKVVATETADDSGMFVGTFQLTQSTRSSTNLYAIPGDTITAKYTDHTLPGPSSIASSKDILAHAVIGSNTPDTQRITLGQVHIVDSTGNAVNGVEPFQQIQIVNNVQNNEDYPQKFTCIIQISDSSGAIISLAWIGGELDVGQRFDVSQSWIPQEVGSYKIESFVWRSLDDPKPLSPSTVQSIVVQ